jgi:hypothetical protein
MTGHLGAAAGLVAALCGFWLATQPSGGRSTADPRSTAETSAGERLPGTWEVTSVQRNGVPESEEVGGLLRFEGNEVTFEPKEQPARPLLDFVLS